MRNGRECTSAEAQQESWKRYCIKTLKIQSKLDVEELRKVRHRPRKHEMADFPSKEE